MNQVFWSAFITPADRDKPTDKEDDEILYMIIVRAYMHMYMKVMVARPC